MDIKYDLLQQASLIAIQAFEKGDEMKDLVSEIIECLLLVGFMIFGLGAMAMTIIAKGG
jgi:hypothetical protein